MVKRPIFKDREIHDYRPFIELLCVSTFPGVKGGTHQIFIKIFSRLYKEIKILKL